jgi:hypothetical protein
LWIIYRRKPERRSYLYQQHYCCRVNHSGTVSAITQAGNKKIKGNCSAWAVTIKGATLIIAGINETSAADKNTDILAALGGREHRVITR